MMLAALALLLCGTMGIVLLPPGSTPDVWAHVYRVDAIVNGDMLARPVHAASDEQPDAAHNVGGRVDDDMVRFSLAHKGSYVCGLVAPDSIAVDDGRTAEVPFDNTAVYPPSAYLPQLTAFALGKVLSLNASQRFYLAEAFMLATYVALACAGLMLLPCRRLPAIAVAMLMTVPASFAISADSQLDALALMFACLLYRCMQRRPSATLCLALSVTAGLLALAKLSYAPFALMPVVAVARHQHLPARQRLITLVGCAVSIALLLAWMLVGTGYATNPSRVSDAQIAVRKRMTLMNPWPLIRRIIGSIVRLQDWTWWESPLLLLFWLLMAAAIASALLAWRRRGTRQSVVWLLLWLLMAACVMLIYASVWLEFTTEQESGVGGINSRYFLPLVPLLVLQLADCLSAPIENRRAVTGQQYGKFGTVAYPEPVENGTEMVLHRSACQEQRIRDFRVGPPLRRQRDDAPVHVGHFHVCQR